MPNYVTNKVSASKSVLDRLLDVNGEVDFNRVLACPSDDSKIFTATKHALGNGLIGWGIDGYSPLDWCREHWGTKWNAIDSLNYETSVEFLTAWSAPFPVYSALSEIFPDEPIKVMYADEDLGNNLGHVVFRNGKVTEVQSFEMGSEEAISFAYEVTGYEREDF